MSAKFSRRSMPPPALYQSQWWLRLASFSTGTTVQREATEAKVFAQREFSATKRGLRQRMRWPPYLRSLSKIDSYLKLEWLLEYSSGLFQKRTHS